MIEVESEGGVGSSVGLGISSSADVVDVVELTPSSGTCVVLDGSPAVVVLEVGHGGKLGSWVQVWPGHSPSV